MELNINKINSILQRQIQQATQRIFRAKLSDQDCYNGLYICYHAQCAMKGARCNDDKETLEHIQKAAKWLVSGKKPGLLLYGGIGNGKTTLARAIIRLIGLISDLNDPYTKTYQVSALEISRRALSDEQYIKDLKQIPILMIDDVGIEPETIKCYGNEISPITDLLYARYDQQLFTLVTSNLNMEQIKERYGSRIYDRVNELFNKIPFNQVTYRK